MTTRMAPTLSIAFFLVAVPCVAPAAAQLKADSGEIVGSVIDEQGARIPHVSIALLNAERGFIRRTMSGANGEYRFPLVPPSRYRLEFNKRGFNTRTTQEFQVLTGETVTMQAALVVAGVAITLDVTPLSPSVLNPERVAQAGVVTSGVIESFPINRRNYLDFALLAPGVVDTTTITDQADFRVPIAPTSGLSFGSSNGRGNVVLVDGLNNNGATGNVRPSVPQEAVHEFQINRNSYSAEYGGGLGGVVNIVTDSGANRFRGTVFALVRNDSFDARNYFDPESSTFERLQAGASTGGPLIKDRAFYFGAFERLDRRETVFVPVLQDSGVLNRLPASQQRLIEFLGHTGDATFGTLAGTLQHILTPANNPLVEPRIKSDSGAFPLTGDSTQASFRFDHRLSVRHQLMARMNFTNQLDRSSRFGALVGYSHGNQTRWRDGTLVLGDTYVLNQRWVGVTRFSIARTEFRMLPNDTVGPELLIGGFGSFGRDYLLPFVQRERYLEFQQALSYASENHSVKLGVGLNPIHDEGRVDTFFGGRFVFGEFIPLSSVLGVVARDPTLPARVRARLSSSAPELAAGLDQPITSLQAFSLGLPVAYVQAFGNPGSESSRSQHSAFIEYSYRPTSGSSLIAGLRPQFNSNTNLRSVAYIEPRVGFSWMPREKTLLRGGYGVFHSWVDLNIAYSATQLTRPDVTNVFIPLSGVPNVRNPLTGLPVTSADVYQYLLGSRILGARPITLGDLAPLGVDSRIRFPVTGGVQEDYTSPHSRQASLEVEHVLSGFTLSAAYNYSRTSHLWRTRDHNLQQIGVRPDGYPIFGPVDPTISNNFIIESAGRASYHALVLQANRPASRVWSVGANYTFSRGMDDVTDFNIDYAPHNQLDPAAEWAPSSFNPRHRLVATALLQSPAASPQSAWLAAAGAHWTLASVIRASAGRPFNVLTGYDNLGDGQVNTHRPLGAGRNIGRGPTFFSIDLRATKVFGFSTRHVPSLELTVEAFNLLNRTNFQAVNNVVGSLELDELPNPVVGHRGNPVTPLAFAAAYDARQLQFGARVRF
jgi:hypothetical protein